MGIWAYIFLVVGVLSGNTLCVLVAGVLVLSSIHKLLEKHLKRPENGQENQ